MASAKVKRKLWSDESMCAAVKSVQDGKGLREASRLYNIPVETLRRQTFSMVMVDCKLGHSTDTYNEISLMRSWSGQGKRFRYLIKRTLINILLNTL